MAPCAARLPAGVYFATLPGIATGVHADLFTRNLSFVAWAALYASTPLLVAVAVGSADVHWERPAAWAFVTLAVLALVSYGALTLWAELRRVPTSDPAGRRPVS